MKDSKKDDKKDKKKEAKKPPPPKNRKKKKRKTVRLNGKVVPDSGPSSTSENEADNDKGADEL